MSELEPVIGAARQYLTLRAERNQPDTWLWEHSERVMRLAEMIATIPELGDERPDPTALRLAALYHDAGWAQQWRRGELTHLQVLNRPTNDVQRELGAGILEEQCAGKAAADTIHLAAEAIRLCNNRNTRLPEARALAEAESLDEIGVTYILRQFRAAQSDGRSVEQLLTSWKRQKEYRYWEARINDCLRYETCREVARRRIAAVEQLMQTLEVERGGEDLRALLRERAG